MNSIKAGNLLITSLFIGGLILIGITLYLVNWWLGTIFFGIIMIILAFSFTYAVKLETLHYKNNQ